MTQLTMYDTGQDPGSDPSVGGSWNYREGGYTTSEAISYGSSATMTQSNDVRVNLYHARLGELTGNPNFFDLQWIPSYGNYNGNGIYDAWLKWQAWEDIYGTGRQLTRSQEDADYIREQLALYQAQNPNADPLNLKPIDGTDFNGFEHDLRSFGGVVRDIANHVTLGVNNFVQTLLTGNLYALGSVPFIGALGVVYNTAQGIAGGVAAVGGGLVSAGASLFGGFSGALSNIASGNFSGAINSLVGGISDAFDALGNALAKAFKALFPVVVDLDGDGVELLSVAHADLRIDIGGGEYRQTGWVGPDDGIVAYDANGNGLVDGYAEFGLTNFSATASTDLEALAAFDTNGDGVFDAQDEAFDQFMIWRDLNGDGVCQEGEAMSFADAGLLSIGLALNGEAGSRAGNFVANTTVVAFADGVAKAAADVAFASSGASDSARMLAVDVTSHALGHGLEVVTIGTGVDHVALDRGMLDAETTQLVVAASTGGGMVSVLDDVATTFLGGLGDDIFMGSDAGSTFMGGGGDNVFVAGTGRDTYVVNDGAKGFDTVIDRAGADTFVLSGEFTFSLAGQDLMIQSDDGEYGMRVVDWLKDGDGDIIMLNGQTLDLSGLSGWMMDPLVSLVQPPHRETDYLVAA